MEKNKRQVPRLRFPGFNDAWEQRKLGEILEINQIPVPKPSSSYIRLGIRSHGKGTFHEQVEAGSGLAVDTMFKVETDNLIINITFAWELALAVTDAEDDGKLVSHRFPQYKFKSQYSPTFFKNLIYDKKFKSDLMLASPGGAGRNRVLKKSEFLDIERTVPKQIEEQTAIGNFFKQLDAAIASHQRKLERVKELKKSLLQKMFPKDGEAFPELRFPNFTDAWEQRKLGEVAERVTRKNTEMISKLPLTISAQYGLIAQTEFFDKQIASKNISGYYLIKNGEFAYNKSYSNGYPWGAVKRLNNYDYGVLSTLYIVFKPTNINSQFLVSYYDTNYWHNQVASIAVEGARNHGLLNISASEFFTTTLAIPKSIQEQTAIGDFFRQLDAAIASHQRKLEHMQALKKGLLQQMFV